MEQVNTYSLSDLQRLEKRIYIQQLVSQGKPVHITFTLQEWLSDDAQNLAFELGMNPAFNPEACQESTSTEEG